ncbi:hypothetical protein CLV68_0920 [Actinokineospora cianjurensis]|uniref:Uncharacterized protein n=1 Tax=Actinokineospora cianjurensis TaxID=585224 RepID=A0A421B7D6_9PSEU|nr:hypothetical protein CLV68_0920 [Actinokineospora cianjurensis]
MADLTPQFSCTFLRFVGKNPESSFSDLVKFVRRTAETVGRANEVDVRFEVSLTADDTVDDIGSLADSGVDNLYCLVREAVRTATWIPKDAGVVDVVNELVLVVRRGDLVVVHGPTPTTNQLRKWVERQLAPYRFLPPDVITATFKGDGKAVWMRGIHRRRSTKADTKALSGIRLQDTINPIEDSTYLMNAAKIDFQPDDDTNVVRDQVTLSPLRSRISWKRTLDLEMFLIAAAEICDLLEKSLVDASVAEPLFPNLAEREADLTRVRGAYEIAVLDPDMLRGDPDVDEEEVARAEVLVDVVLEVRPGQGVAAEVDVGYNGAKAGTLVLKPLQARSDVTLDVRFTGDASHSQVLTQIAEDMRESAALAVYYESGHVYRNRLVLKERVTSTPFHQVEFADFSGFVISREKPRQKDGQTLHDAIGAPGDDSLFAWVVQRYATGWLLCDDGAGEVADFLHLSDAGVLTAIHVKAAGNSTGDRGIAVARFEQVVSQAEKNIGYLNNDVLVDHLISRPTQRASWYDGERANADEFVDQLRLRVASDRTYVVIVQPHLLESAYKAARSAADTGAPTIDSRRLALLDNLLHSTRRSITGRCDDLKVIGAT